MPLPAMLRSQPKSKVPSSSTHDDQTMWAIKSYTTMDHTTTNTTQAENFMRPATAPEMMAGYVK